MYREAVNEAAHGLTNRGQVEFSRADIEGYIQTNQPSRWNDFAPSAQVNFSAMQSSDPDCIVERLPGSFLYRISHGHSEVALAVADREQNDFVQPRSSRQSREEKLYAVLREWLESKNYQAEITANSRSGGQWGNPDVTGVRLDELPMGVTSFECVTIEAKVSLENWRQYIFEAVAHKRFAHRAWFAFAFGTDSPTVDSIEVLAPLCEYAEKYRIGVLAVFVNETQYEHLCRDDVSSLVLDADTTKIDVVWPAFYEHVQPSTLSGFLVDVVGIQSNADFRRYGGR